MVDTVVPVLGPVTGTMTSTFWPSVPIVVIDNWDYNRYPVGPAPQWADDSDDTYATTITHGDGPYNRAYQSASDPGYAGLTAPVNCNIAPCWVPSDVYGLTVRVRARIRPMSPPELDDWVGPPWGGDAFPISFTLYSRNPNPPTGDYAYHYGATSNFLNGVSFEPGWTDEPAGTKFWWPVSWEPSWQELYMPAVMWNWHTWVWDEEVFDWVVSDQLYPGGRQFLTDAIRYGARIEMQVSHDTEQYGNSNQFTRPYDEVWADIYEVQIVAHSTGLTGELSGQDRAFKGARR